MNFFYRSQQRTFQIPRRTWHVIASGRLGVSFGGNQPDWLPLCNPNAGWCNSLAGGFLYFLHYGINFSPVLFVCNPEAERVETNSASRHLIQFVYSLINQVVSPFLGCSGLLTSVSGWNECVSFIWHSCAARKIQFASVKARHPCKEASTPPLMSNIIIVFKWLPQQMAINNPDPLRVTDRNSVECVWASYIWAVSFL